jgi:hypothetical protein
MPLSVQNQKRDLAWGDNKICENANMNMWVSEFDGYFDVHPLQKLNLNISFLCFTPYLHAENDKNSSLWIFCSELIERL